MKKLYQFLGFIVSLFIVGGVSYGAIDPYTDKGNFLEIKNQSVIPQGGEIKTDLAKTEPAITFSKWNSEVAMKVTSLDISPTTQGERALLSDTMKWKDGAKEVWAYPLAKVAGMEDGGFELSIILNSKPATNVFSFAISGAENLIFYYQPALDADQIARGDTRPDNVVGSYAVYYSKRDHINGQTNYATGKAYHIYRPKVTDANSSWVWADLSYSNGVLSITVPQSFLDSAVYPITI